MITPFGPSVEEVPLPSSPLVNVIAQVRFPAVMKIEADKSFVSTFQEAIRQDYPILRPERQLGVMIGPSGVHAPGRRHRLALRSSGPRCMAGDPGLVVRLAFG